MTAKDWKRLERIVRKVLAEVIREEAQHGGYDGATPVTDDEWAEEGKKKRRRRRIGFKP